MTAPEAPSITVVLATGNRDKVRELKPLLTVISPRLEVCSLADLELDPDIEETESTLEGNARLKASAIHAIVETRFPWLLVLADDTGLEVNALNGAPGVYSARFAPVPGGAPSYDDNVAHLLECMKGIENRYARFRTVIALMGRLPLMNGGTIRVDETIEGAIKGSITESRQGSDGFGYDPLFIPEGLDSTFAELGLDEKNRISHRARAVAGAATRIRALLSACGLASTGSTPPS